LLLAPAVRAGALDEDADQLPFASWARQTNGSRSAHAVEAIDQLLELARSDGLAADRQHVLAPSHHVQFMVGAEVSEVSSAQPPARLPREGRRGRVVQVAIGEGGASEHDLADGPGVGSAATI